MAERIELNIPTPPGVTNVTAEVPEGYFKLTIRECKTAIFGLK